MTALGINITTQDPTYTWAHIARGRYTKASVMQARENAEEAWQAVDNAIEANKKADFILALTNTARDLEQAARREWEAWNDELAEQLRELDRDECTCRPDGSGTTCPACVERARKNEIEF